MGKLLIDAIQTLDRPVIVAHLIIIVLLFVLINLVVDVLYTVLDPRVRVGSQGRMSVVGTPRRSRDRAAADSDRPRRPRRRCGGFLSDYFESRIATAAFVAAGADHHALALLAPLIAPQNPYNLAEVDVLDSRLPPGSKGMAGYTYWLGTDGAGRDLVSAMLYGLRISLRWASSRA